jgi:amino acid adenylation domain-containing protein
VLDGWSRAALTTSLYNRYEQLLAGERPEAPAVDWTYRRFVAQEQAVLADPAAKEHFARTLEEAPGQQIPHRRERSERGQGYRVEPAFFELSAPLVALARELGVPVQVVLLAAHLKALSTVSGLARAMTAVTQNGRPEREGGERALGLFLNSVPMGLSLEAGSWRELVQRVAALNTATLGWRSYPLSKIQQDLGREFSEVLFNYTHFHVFAQMSEGDRTSGGGLEVLGSSGFEQTNFGLLVDVARGLEGDGLRLAFVYDTGQYDEATIASLSGYFVTACERMLSDLEASHAKSLLSEAQIAQLRDWSGPQGSFEDGRCLHEWFEAQVDRQPDAIAVTCESLQLSYAELESRANRVAHALRAKGVGPDQRVGLCVERSLEMVIGILGILKAGGGYVPLDPAYPEERLAYLVEDSAPVVVVTQRGLEARLPAGTPCWLLDSDLSPCPDTRLPVETIGLAPGHLAYVIYTSGSTGQPKGVEVAHRHVQRLLSATEAQFGFGPQDVWTLFHSYAFDFTVWELWGALAYGGRLVVVPHWVARSPEDFHALLQRERVTVLNQTPTAFMSLAQVDAQRGVDLNLRVVVFGGEALNLVELKDWVARRGDEQPQLVNMYGITETTVHVTYRRIRRAEIDGNTGSVIGRPIADLSVHVLDANRERVPVGTAGELYVGGGGVSRGYLNRPELTAERFVVDPHGDGVLYRTGDLARYRDDGDLEYLGRIDAQVKIRGFRIELGEIEQQLSALPGVQSAVVLAREDAPGHKRLVAYVVPVSVVVDEDEKAGEDVIARYRRQLGDRLPEHMVPSAFVVLDALPLTANGKVDRKALPAPDAAATVAYVAPRNATEQALCDVWQEVLRRERVGIGENFFSVGGDSILSIRIVSRLKARGLQIQIKDLFEHQTIEQLAPFVSGRSDDGVLLEPFALLTEEERPLFGEEVEDAYPLSALQAGMVFHTQLEQFSGLYHDIVTRRLRSPWQPERFEQALAACVAEHPVLRTGFRLDGERPLQFVRKHAALPLCIEDLQSLAGDEQDTYLANWTETHKRHVFDWESGPLFQTHVFLLAADRFAFVMSFHHAVLDGWSLATLTTQLYNRYEAALASEEVPEVTANRGFRDFIALEQAALADPDARVHFAAMLEDVQPQQLPRGTGPGGARRIEQHQVMGFADGSEALPALARRLGVPVQQVLLAGHFKVLSLLSGHRRAVSCVTYNGRPEQEGAERAMGLFLNSLPLAIDVGPCDWRELIARTAAVSTASVAHRLYPISRIQQDVDLTFAEAAFNFTNFHVYRDAVAPTNSALEVLDSMLFEETNFEFLADFSQALEGDALFLTLKYDASLFDAALMARIGHYYTTAFVQLREDIERSHLALPLLERDEIVLLRDQRNATTAPYSRVPAHRLIEAQSHRNPDAIAVVCGDVSLSYAQLDIRANRLARYLIEAGVELGSRVGLHLERSAELVIALLGVLKAGGCYVPLEPGLPRERLAAMAADAQIGWVLLTSEGLERLPLGGVDVMSLDGAATDADWLVEYDDTAVDVAVTADDLAYVLYTSGSTGTPKGVMVPHGALANYLDHATKHYLDDTMLGAVVSSPLGFDATLTTLLPALLGGKQVELLPDGDALLEALSSRLYDDTQPQLFKITPAHLEALGYLAEGRVGHAAHCIVVGGEQLSVAMLQQWKGERLPQATFVNEYGPTETVVGCSVYEVATQAQLQGLSGRSAVPIGRPIQNTQLYVLGEGMQLQPEGSLGELYIGGDGVTRGYLNRDELTAERFVANPFGEGRLYRSGDLVRWLADGELAFEGRRDEQVKIRGFRIELGEIESVLRSVDGVREAVAVARNDGPQGEKRLVAYVVSSAESASLIITCREAAQSRLPEYMIPSAFVVLDALPLTANGKIDRKALPAPEASEAVAYRAPRNAIEQALCDVWQEVLRREQVGIADNFFSLGGDSILSIRIVSLLKARGLQIAIKDIFQHQTIEQLAVYVTEQEHGVLEQMKETAIKQKELLTTAGIEIEEGVF